MKNDKKKKEESKPMSSGMIQMEKAKLMEYINSQNFGSIDEMNEFLDKNVKGKKIDEIVPAKKGRKSDKQKSDDLMYQAYDSDPAKGKKLANEALKLNPENIRAYNYLAEMEKTPKAASVLFKKGVDIGASQLGEDFFAEHKGFFWGMIETRPYMTARLGFADCMRIMGNIEDCVLEYQAMLELNPNDNQGVRYLLAGVLLKNKLYKDYYTLHKKFKDEGSTFWLYNYALYLFITKGTTPEANKALREAYKQNKHVIAYMIRKKEIKSGLKEYYSPGDENEAAFYLIDNLEAWMNHPETLDWILGFMNNYKN